MKIFGITADSPHAEQRAALEELIEHGVSIFPVRPDKKPFVSWKCFQDRTPSHGELAAWLRQFPGCGFGLVTGRQVSVVDLDTPEAIQWAQENLPATRVKQSTPRGGEHWLYGPMPPDVTISAGEGLDVRSRGGYVVIAPAPGYVMTCENATGSFSFDDLPRLETRDIQMIEDYRRAQKIPTSIASTDQPVVEGERNTALTRVVGRFVAKGFRGEALFKKALKANLEFDPPLEQPEVRAVCASIVRTDQRNRTTISQRSEDPQIDTHESEPLPDWVIEMNEKHGVVVEAGKTTVLNIKDWDPIQERHVLTRTTFQDFKNKYCNRLVTTGLKSSGEPRVEAKGHAWLKHPHRQDFEGVVFAPKNDVPAGYFNMWRGFAVDPVAGDWSLMQEHLLQNIARNNQKHYDYLLRWMAFGVQYPDQVPEVAIVVRGGRGTGKGLFAREYGGLFGEAFFHVSNSQHVTGTFNAHLQNCVVVFFDEAIWAGNKPGESVLKQLITEPLIAIEAKYRNPVMVKNHLHVLLCGNASWLVPSGVDERRFFVLDVSDSKQQDHGYFKKINQQMRHGGRSAMLHDLLNFDLGSWHPREAPKTRALLEQKRHSFNPREAWWYECLWEGRMAGAEEASGWPKDHLRVAKEHAYQSYLSHAKSASTSNHRGTQTQIGMFLSKVMGSSYPRPCTVEITRTKEAGPNNYMSVPAIVSGYELPPLSECRRRWERMMDQEEDWPLADEEREPDLPF